MSERAPFVWETDDRLVVDGTAYVLMDGEPEPGELHLYKPRLMVEAYEAVIAEFQHPNLLELGIYAGGSAAYFMQRCEPRRLVALDRSPDRSAELDRFVDTHDLHDRLILHYGVDQCDRSALLRIAQDGFGGEPLDLVIDDASHRYGPTVASFEALFPLVRLGGLYVIEDWTADSWLAVLFSSLTENRDPVPRAITERWLASVLADPNNPMGVELERWAFRALRDAPGPQHEAATTWYAELARPDAGEEAQLIRRRIEARLATGLAELDGPTLATLGLQLLLAVKGLCPSIASVTVTPWWIAIRRGGPIDPATFTVESIGRDAMDVLGSYLDLGRRTDGRAAFSPAP